MKRRIVLVSAIITISLGIGYVVLKSPSTQPPNTFMRDWKRSPLPAEYSQTESLPKNSWDKNEISICEQAIASSGISDRIELHSVSITKDKKATFYFFSRPNIFGATYVIQLNSITHEIVAKYILPDA
jgi:hypothetical protein